MSRQAVASHESTHAAQAHGPNTSRSVRQLSGGSGFVDSIDPAAEAAFGAIRNQKSDVADVARHSKLPPAVVERVKNHLFMQEHNLSTALGQPAEKSRFVAIQDHADLWKKAQEGKLKPGETERFMNLMTHENVEATLAGKGLNILEPHDPAQGMRPFRARGAHDLASIAERNFDPKLVAKMPPETRDAHLRAMVEATMEVRGAFSDKALAGMPPDVQEMARTVARQRAAGAAQNRGQK